MKTIKVKFYERHEDDAPVYTRKEYDYFCRFPNVTVGMPVVVESAYGLGLAKVTAIDVDSNKATKHVIGYVVTEVPAPLVQAAIAQTTPKPPGLKPPPMRAKPISEDEIPY